MFINCLVSNLLCYKVSVLFDCIRRNWMWQAKELQLEFIFRIDWIQKPFHLFACVRFPERTIGIIFLAISISECVINFMKPNPIHKFFWYEITFWLSDCVQVHFLKKEIESMNLKGYLNAYISKIQFPRNVYCQATKRNRYYQRNGRKIKGHEAKQSQFDQVMSLSLLHGIRRKHIHDFHVSSGVARRI